MSNPDDDDAHATGFDDRPGRFRKANPDQHFDGASGVLFEQAMAQTRMAICLADPSQPDQPLVFVNGAFTNLTGYEEDEVLGRNCRFLQGPETDARVVAKVREAIETEDVIVVELLNYRKDGSTFWNALHLGPIYDEAGKLIYYFGSQWNVSDVHAARSDEKHARMIARELSHRMKNMFSVIGGLVTVTGRTRGVEAEAAEINDRIRALGRAFETTLDEAALGTVDIKSAVEAVLEPYDPEQDRLTLSGPHMRVDPNLISTIGITLHELATNAMKYGALRGEAGTVEVTWGRIDADDGMRLEWTETGGPVVNEPGRIGSGLGIVKTLLATIGGTLDTTWAEGGLEIVIRIPYVMRD